MKRSKFIVNFRNKLAMLAMDCDSAAAINEGRMSAVERQDIQSKLREIVSYIDKKILV